MASAQRSILGHHSSASGFRKKASVADDQLAHNARAAEVLAEVHAREPLHPGAIHHTIHADDAREIVAPSLPRGQASSNLVFRT